MRRTLALILSLAMAVLLSSSCGGSDNANNANVDDGITSPGQTVSNSNMAPTGGPGPEPENAGSVSKGANENKPEKKNSNKR